MIDPKYKTMRIHYPFFSIKYPIYVKIGIIAIILSLLAAIPCYIFSSEGQNWVLRYAWGLLIITAVGVSIETPLMIKLAKRKFDKH